jgi:hypothetical protein
MYCPQCSQEQHTEQMRFCSGCGFPLVIVSKLVTNGGALPGFDTEGQRQLSPRERGVRWGSLLMIASAVLFPIVLLLTAMKHDLAVLFLPVFLLFLGGLVRLLYAVLRQSPVQQTISPAVATGWFQQSSSTHRPHLPPHQNAPMPGWRPTIDTSEMVQPPSVTDNTTKLLNDADGEKQ